MPSSEIKQVAVVDTETGDVAEVVERFFTVEEAETFIDNHPDQEKVERGGFSIDAPEPVVLETMEEDVEDALRQHEILLKGDVVTVQLYARVEDALTPQEAVERFIRMLIHRGTDDLHFAVTDHETGENHFVKAGMVLAQGEVLAAAEQAEQSG